MQTYTFAAAAILILVGLTLGVIARSYRTAQFRAVPWYKSFTPIWRVESLYVSPGPMLVHVSSSMVSVGAVMLVIGLLLK